MISWYRYYLGRIRQIAALGGPPLPSQYPIDRFATTWGPAFIDWLSETIPTEVLESVAITAQGDRVTLLYKVDSGERQRQTVPYAIWSEFWRICLPMLTDIDPFFSLTARDREVVAAIVCVLNSAHQLTTATLLWQTFDPSALIWEGSVIYLSIVSVSLRFLATVGIIGRSDPVSEPDMLPMICPARCCAILRAFTRIHTVSVARWFLERVAFTPSQSRAIQGTIDTVTRASPPADTIAMAA